jgi:hypothetical protein
VDGRSASAAGAVRTVREAATTGRNGPVRSEPRCVLTMVCITLGVCALVVGGIAKASHEIMRRLDLDLMTVLLWLGLAEWPLEPRPRRHHPTA